MAIKNLYLQNLRIAGDTWSPGDGAAKHKLSGDIVVTNSSGTLQKGIDYNINPDPLVV